MPRARGVGGVARREGEHARPPGGAAASRHAHRGCKRQGLVQKSISAEMRTHSCKLYRTVIPFPGRPCPSLLSCEHVMNSGQESGGDFVTEEQLEVARNGAVHQREGRPLCTFLCDKIAPGFWVWMNYILLRVNHSLESLASF